MQHIVHAAHSSDGLAGPASERVLLTTSSFSSAEMRERCGDDCYSYYFVARAFAPLLSRWGAVQEVRDGQSRLDEAVAEARRRRLEPLHLSFLPPQYMPLAKDAANIAFPFWEFPDIPHYDVAGNPRNNWASVCQNVSLILTACQFTHDAFAGCGVKAPLAIVSVPVRSEYFETPNWQPGQQVSIDCRAYELRPLAMAEPTGSMATGSMATGSMANGSATAQATPRLRDRARRAVAGRVRGYLPGPVRRGLSAAGRMMLGQEPAPPPVAAAEPALPYQAAGPLRLEGIVYTTILNPFDMRKNWRLLIHAFLEALAEREDAMLVLKLAVSKTMTRTGLEAVFGHYLGLKMTHRCKVMVVSDYLDDGQMVELARGSTYYLNASKAEGACLPLQDFLSAGRPGIAPAHTAMAEYVDEQLAFVVPSTSEPTHWPWDPERTTTTSWHVVDRGDLVERIRVSYSVARAEGERYLAMASQGRARMRELVGMERVWPRLVEALGKVSGRRAGGDVVSPAEKTGCGMLHDRALNP